MDEINHRRLCTDQEAKEDDEELFQFEEMELKALIYLSCTQMAKFVVFEAPKYTDEVKARKDIEARIMGFVDEQLAKKRKDQCQ